MINKRLERQKIERLLPWHAAGTLSRREADLVERALAGDTELAQRYDLVRQEFAETIDLNETLGAPSERAMEKLFAAIEAEEARAPLRRLNREPSRLRPLTLNNDAPSAHSGSLPTAARAPRAVSSPPRHRER